LPYQKNGLFIAIGDSGIGIKASLAKRYNTSDWSDSLAIRNSVQKGCSAYSARGLGLTFALKTVKKYGGTISIRSNSGRLNINDRIQEKNITYIPGTHISIYLPVDLSNWRPNYSFAYTLMA
jgi:signal transduction histidine kinase